MTSPNAQAYMLNLLGLQGASSSEDDYASPARQHDNAPVVHYPSSPSPSPQGSPARTPTSPTPPAPHRRSVDAAVAARAFLAKQQRIRTGKRVESSHHRVVAQGQTRMEKVRQRLGLFKGKGRAAAAAPSPPPSPSDPEDPDYPSHYEEESSLEESLASDAEYEREEYASGRETLQQLHFFQDNVAQQREEEEEEDEEYTPSPARPRGQERLELGEVDMLRAMGFGPTRYPDGELLSGLGIRDDVEAIF